MIEAETNNRNLPNEAHSSPRPLKDKVILLIGNNADMLQSLAVEFAEYGGDIALASSKLPGDISGTIEKQVEEEGGRFLRLDKSLMADVEQADTVVKKVKEKLGKMDILIDISAHDKNKPNVEMKSGAPKSQWWLSTAILEELT